MAGPAAVSARSSSGYEPGLVSRLAPAMAIQVFVGGSKVNASSWPSHLPERLAAAFGGATRMITGDPLTIWAGRYWIFQTADAAAHERAEAHMRTRAGKHWRVLLIRTIRFDRQPTTRRTQLECWKTAPTRWAERYQRSFPVRGRRARKSCAPSSNSSASPLTLCRYHPLFRNSSITLWISSFASVRFFMMS